MEIRGLTNSSRIEGLNSLSQKRLFPEETTTRLIRFSFNLRSVSFVLVEAPTEWGLSRGRDTMRIVKVRCINPIVEFISYARCLPQIGRLTFDASPNEAYVDVDGFAHIRCEKVIVNEETKKAVSPMKELTSTLLD